MSSLFTRIIQREIPAEILLEDDRYLAFLDIRPLAPGHALVIPKHEHDYLFTLDDDTLSGLLPFAKRLVPAIEKAVACKRVGVMVAGLEVPHTHIHLIPISSVHDLNFALAKPTTPEQLAEVGKKIRAHL